MHPFGTDAHMPIEPRYAFAAIPTWLSAAIISATARLTTLLIPVLMCLAGGWLESGQIMPSTIAATRFVSVQDVPRNGRETYPNRLIAASTCRSEPNVLLARSIAELQMCESSVCTRLKRGSEKGGESEGGRVRESAMSHQE